MVRWYLCTISVPWFLCDMAFIVPMHVKPKFTYLLSHGSIETKVTTLACTAVRLLFYQSLQLINPAEICDVSWQQCYRAAC